MIAEFAQIVGLLAAFNSGRRTKRVAELSEFLTWLVDHDHEDIKNAIESNHATTISIKAFMNLGFQEVSEKLDYISGQTAMLSSLLEGADHLARAYVPNNLSNQAIELLALMDEHEAEYFLESREIGAGPLRLVLSRGPNFICPETRFFRDDVEILLWLGLLRLDYNPKGEPMYYITRAASQLVKSRSEHTTSK